jgi:hypothetical protein
MGLFTLIRHPIQTVKALNFASKVIEQKKTKYLPENVSIPEKDTAIDGVCQKRRYSDLKRLDDELKKEERELEYLTLKAEKELELERLTLEKEKIQAERDELYADDEDDDEEPKQQGAEAMLMGILTKAMSGQQRAPQTAPQMPLNPTPTPQEPAQEEQVRKLDDNTLQMAMTQLNADQKQFISFITKDDFVRMQELLK